jgi:hypothetical protein
VILKILYQLPFFGWSGGQNEDKQERRKNCDEQRERNLFCSVQYFQPSTELLGHKNKGHRCKAVP